MCDVLKVNRSGFYAWRRQPESKRIKEDKRLLGKIKQFWLESGCVYDYRNLTLDMRDDGETCGKNRVYRIMKAAKYAQGKFWWWPNSFGSTKHAQS